MVEKEVRLHMMELVFSPRFPLNRPLVGRARGPSVGTREPARSESARACGSFSFSSLGSFVLPASAEF